MYMYCLFSHGDIKTLWSEVNMKNNKVKKIDGRTQNLKPNIKNARIMNFWMKNNVIIKYFINIEEKTQTIQHIWQHNPIKHYINTSFYMIWSQISKSTSPRLWSGDYCWWLFWRQFSFTEYELWQAKTGRVESSQPRLESGNKPSPKAEWSQVFYAKDMRV